MKAEGRGQEAEVLDAIATALRYPVPRPSRLECAADFFDETAHVDDRGMEELYTTTFDLNPVATLEVGYHLWGEQYERGRFLSDLRGLQQTLGIDSGTELPDHLTVLLPTIAASNDDTLREHCTKAIDKILIRLDEQGNPYRHLLRAAHSALSTQDSALAAGGGR